MINVGPSFSTKKFSAACPTTTHMQIAAGYVDLGMAYEREGDPAHAHESFVKSESLDGDNPAAYMQEAILDTRLHKVDEANSAFNKAEAIFAREMNLEGLAELDYERGYEANVEGDSERANFFLSRSLAKATEIENIQLEIRDLTQLSSVACASGHAEDAVNLAQRAIDRARAHQLDTWAAMGLARLANARYVEGPQHFSEAETAINEALNLVKDSRQGRAEALANVTLAGLRDDSIAGMKLSFQRQPRSNTTSRMDTLSPLQMLPC